MRIEKIISHTNNGFIAIYQCEHCGHETEDNGFDDDYFYNKIIPIMRCGKCRKKAGSEQYKDRER